MIEESPIIVGGRYGLSSKDTTPAQIKAKALDNLKWKLLRKSLL